MNTQPKHVAIIMDGNGRWAQKLGKKRVVGHQQGAKTVRENRRGSRTASNRIPYTFCLFYRKLESSQRRSQYSDEIISKFT